MNQEIELGDKVRDKLTGLEGIVTQRIENLNGCIQFTVRSAVDKDGKLPECYCHDIQNLEVIKKDPHKLRPKALPTGGPESRPPRSA